mmetsp:Transcript_3609/g.7894  ORF Transcript_3609/g.7894 Transcript_3609/m.7894 type:complete len:359 (+) Transcript_3609:161-1237(+)|eukprot:CAMPEP_0201132742 /NCGR_PEP_ID=MMETSP0850-20130426/46705_1 /ASSEMBLY_ACC=CAM_ASM_000622 /TAXON_ID=183588 /ORGANISM="Pseudo-nitzschia fraudulenta, Strain WWA7" /LENGTH=358 /DNA_ID=CAMNT_0047403163 /DNA_START=88 /DNA_END=1164 /DNA_ORIENTATION=-
MVSNGEVNINYNRRLWLSPEEFSGLTCYAMASTVDDCKSRNERTSTTQDTHDTIFEQFSSKPEPHSLVFFLSNTVVLVQEFVLTCFLLAGHRAARVEELDYIRRQQNGIPIDGTIRSGRLLTSLGLIWFTLVVAVVQNRFANSKRYRVRHRFTDFLLMAILLRFLSAVLKTLTASYSSDTVYALSTASLLLHLLTCDYDYANGLKGDDVDIDGDACSDRGTPSLSKACSSSSKNPERPTFKGGMISLTSAFFATTLLASRFETNIFVYIFVCSSVILFALYPAARHLVAVKATTCIGRWVPIFVSGILTLALAILLEPGETLVVLVMTLIIGIFVPIWKYHLQYYKVMLRGPWDIAHV